MLSDRQVCTISLDEIQFNTADRSKNLLECKSVRAQKKIESFFAANGKYGVYSPGARDMK